ncbi:hypothetical protein XENTR_v10012024 [Xenopus tropicalis]|nr:hypothetical protein XENTR_v10012024 [Xenopus tropicalis]
MFPFQNLFCPIKEYWTNINCNRCFAEAVSAYFLFLRECQNTYKFLAIMHSDFFNIKANLCDEICIPLFLNHLF